tara:strand:+ start:60 stop:557 length:498 start_codon:yes stop_codon:yes gene_type:complete
MIYQTIPVQYLDHDDLLKAIRVAWVLGRLAVNWANKAIEDLMNDDVTSGTAVNIGEFVNYAKNVECITYHWYDFLFDKASKFKIITLSFTYRCKKDDYDYIDKMMLAASNSPIRDVIQNAYNEWTHQLLLPLSMKYKWAVEEFDCDFTSNGVAEREMGAPPSEDY